MSWSLPAGCRWLLFIYPEPSLLDSWGGRKARCGTWAKSLQAISPTKYRGTLPGHQWLSSAPGHFPIVQPQGHQVDCSARQPRVRGWHCCQSWRGSGRATWAVEGRVWSSRVGHPGCRAVCSWRVSAPARSLLSFPGHFLRVVPEGPDGRCASNEIPLSSCGKPLSFITNRPARQISWGPWRAAPTTLSAYAKLSAARHREACSAGSTMRQCSRI